MDSNGGRGSDPVQMLIGPVMRSRAKSFKEELLALVKAMWLENDVTTWTKVVESDHKIVN